MLFHILPGENPQSVLTEVRRILRPAGRLGIIH